MIEPSPNIEYSQHPHVYIEREVTVGKRLLIVAEADKGEMYEPILVYNKRMAETFFESGKLVKTYEDACTYQADMEIFLMRIEPLEYDSIFLSLEAFSFDLLFMPDVYLDDNPSLLTKYIELCHTKEEEGELIHVITTLNRKPAYDSLTEVFPIIDSLTESIGDETYEIGKYFSFVSDQIKDKNAGAVYAGLLAAIDPEVSPINKTIKSIELAEEYEKKEILSLQKQGIVCFRKTFRKGIVCSSSSCAVSTEGSIHKHVSNYRIAQFLINDVASEVAFAIGRSNIAYNALTIEEIIDAICSDHVRLNRLRDYAYSVTYNKVKGVINIDIEFVPVFSVHAMETHSVVRVLK